MADTWECVVFAEHRDGRTTGSGCCLERCWHPVCAPIDIETKIFKGASENPVCMMLCIVLFRMGMNRMGDLEQEAPMCIDGICSPLLRFMCVHVLTLHGGSLAVEGQTTT